MLLHNVLAVNDVGRLRIMLKFPYMNSCADDIVNSVLGEVLLRITNFIIISK